MERSILAKTFKTGGKLKMAKVAYETITGHESFDYNGFKSAVKELNESGILSQKVNVIGKKEVAVKRFLDAIEKLSDEDVAKMPDAAFELNNNFIEILEKADDENVVEGEGEEIEEVKDKTQKKPITKKQAKPGVIKTILDCIEKDGPITKEKILAKLIKKFPERSGDKMKKTIAIQIGGKKRPLRMEREKEVKFTITEEGSFSKND